MIGSGCGKTEPAVDTSGQGAGRGRGDFKWEGKLVRRPGTTDEDGKVYLVQGGKRRWVVSSAWLKAHGFRFPEDVSIIPAEELAAIPVGEVIQ